MLPADAMMPAMTSIGLCLSRQAHCVRVISFGRGPRRQAPIREPATECRRLL